MEIGQKAWAIIELIKDEYLVCSLPDFDNAIAFASAHDYNLRVDPHEKYTLGQRVEVSVGSLAEGSEVGRLLLLLTSFSDLTRTHFSKRVKGLSKLESQTLIHGEVLFVGPLEMKIKLGKNSVGKVHVTHVTDDLEEENPLSRYTVGQSVTAKILRRSKQIDDGSLIKCYDLTIKPSELGGEGLGLSSSNTLSLSSLQVGQVVTAYVREVQDDWAWLLISPSIMGRLFVLDSSTDPIQLGRFKARYKTGQAVRCRIEKIDPDSGKLDFSLRDLDPASEYQEVCEVKINDVLGGRVSKILPGVGGLGVQIGSHIFGRVHITQLHDIWKDNPALDFKVGQFVKCIVLDVSKSEDGGTNQVDLSLRQSLINAVEDRGVAAVMNTRLPNPTVEKMEDLSVGMEVQGFVKSIINKGCFVTLSRHLDARIKLSNLAETFINDPGSLFPVGKLVKGRVISLEPLSGFVEMSLRSSFLNDESNNSKMLALKEIHVGDMVTGVVARIESYGIFISICNSKIVGLCHISQVSDSRISNLEALFKPGDRVQAKVLKGICVGKASQIHGLEGFLLTAAHWRDTPSLRARFSPVDSVSDTWTEDSVVYQLMFAIEALLESIRVPVQDLEELCEESEDCMGRLVWLQDQSCWYLPFTFLLRPDWPHPPSVVMWSIRDAAAILGTQEDRLRTWAHEIVSGICRGFSVPWVNEDKKQISLGMKDTCIKEMHAKEELTKGKIENSQHEESLFEQVLDTDVPLEKDEGENKDDDSLTDGLCVSPLSLPDMTVFDSHVEPLDVILDTDENTTSEDVVTKEMDSPMRTETKEKSTKRLKRRIKNLREAAIQEAEQKRLNGDEAPESSEDFEKLVHGSPNSSFIWIKYMAFLLSLGDIEKARAVADRALQIINFREEGEKLNVWVALLNLENAYGNPAKEATLGVFNRALQYCDPKKLYLALLGIYERSGQHDMVDELLKTMLQKFKMSCKVWLKRIHNFLRQSMPEAAHKTLDRALLSLPQRKHIKAISQAAIAEFKIGSAERARNLFESILRNYPKRVDLWNVYLDQETVLGDSSVIRALFERVTSLELPPKKMKSLFKKYLEYEKMHGNEERVEYVKAKAMQYVETRIGLAVSDVCEI
ncbi:hypothetical protein L7F22_000851 [Adiantum nelumboides]|nr:hypothetical protein [Adiantum nelumboides]